MSGLSTSGVVGFSQPSSFYNNNQVTTASTLTVVSSGTNVRGLFINALTVMLFPENGSEPFGRLHGGLTLTNLSVPAGQAVTIEPLQIGGGGATLSVGVYCGGNLIARPVFGIPNADWGAGMANKMAVTMAYKVL